ncbi:hypothetical protein LCGC14_0289140 [marine sediment metagenome]|uniref:Uncharacterized protein n=1 Tax=marine sediment metagenome TaxID=412755 RepID=A0A0F9UAR4_9ZZZZ
MATYRVAVVNEQKRPIAGVVVEAVSLNNWPDVTTTAETGRNGTVQFTGISGPHWFRPRTRRTSTAVGGRVYTGAVEVQVVNSGGEKVCVDFVVDCDGMGTHTTLAAAIAQAITDQANRVIFLCCSVTESDIEIGGLAGGQSITIISHQNRRAIITTNSDEDMFKQTSNGGGSPDGGLFLKDIGLTITTAGYAVFLCDTGTEITNISAERVDFNGGYFVRNDSAQDAMGNLDIRIVECIGGLTGFYQNEGSTPPNDLYALDNDMTLTHWWKELSAGAEGAETNAANSSNVVGGSYTVSEWMTIALSGNFNRWAFKDFILTSGCSGAHFRHSATDTNHRGVHYSDILFIATANDTDFGDFQGPAANPQDNLYIVGIHGVAQSGVTPSGTFLAVDTDQTNPYVADIWAPAWPTVYSGPTITPAVPPVIDHDDLANVTSDQHHALSHDILSTDHPDTLAASVVRGDLLLTNATPVLARLPIGAASTYLKSDATDAAWAAIQAADVGLPIIGTPTYDSVEGLNTVFHSAGWISPGGVISDAGGATINVTAGDGMLRSSDSPVAQLKFIEWPASNGLAITADSIRYIGVELNDPNDPQVVVRTTNNFNNNTDFILGTVVNDGGVLHVQNAPWEVGDHANFMIQRTRGTAPIARDKEVGGIIFSESGTRRVVVSAGQLWRGLTAFVIGALDTDPGGAADTFDEYSSQGKENTGIAQWPNTLYDNGSGGTGSLQTMGNNKWANLWWYIELDTELVMVYGTAQYNTRTEAENEDIPSTLPDRLQVHGILAARFIFQKSAATAAEILSAFDTPFTPSGVTLHADLGTVTSGQHHTQAHKDEHDPEDGADALDTANAAEISVVVAAGTGSSHSLARADHVHAIVHAITDNHIVTIDGGGAGAPASGEYAKWTASGLEGKSAAEVAGDIEGSIDHGSIGGLGDDDHTQYALLAGRTGGQIIYGGENASAFLVLRSTSHGTKGDIALQQATIITLTADIAVDVYSGDKHTIQCTSAGQVLLLGGISTGIVIGADVHLYRAEADLLALAAGDNLNLVQGYIQLEDMSTPSNPSFDDMHFFTRIAGGRIQFIGQGPTGEECVICDVSNTVAPANVLTLNWIE